jgi:uncharacterized protein (DUF2235 family)
LSKNIKAGYAWLCQRYRPGAQIYIFGFSRGAYSARSLGGLIRKCGLATDARDDSIDQAYGMYRDRSVSAADDTVVAYRRQFSREVDIAFVGVWDTVGELGIPIDGVPVPGFSSYYRFHDTTLANTTKAAYHAIAANEFRSLYKPTLWTLGAEDRGSLPLEQRWFAGAHANVGGGYVTPPRDPEDLLPLIPARPNRSIRMRSSPSIIRCSRKCAARSRAQRAARSTRRSIPACSDASTPPAFSMPIRPCASSCAACRWADERMNRA